jgi:hypothetical protein
MSLAAVRAVQSYSLGYQGCPRWCGGALPGQLRSHWGTVGVDWRNRVDLKNREKPGRQRETE